MFHFNDDWSYRMPVHFFGAPGAGVSCLKYDDVTMLSIEYLTDEEQLAQYVPDAFEIREPLVSIGYQKCNGVQWMGGGEYSLIGVNVPARHIASGIDGVYVLVIWEDKTAPILGGREETGMPKVFADIPEYHRYEDHVTLHASHEGRAFLEMQATLERPLSPEELQARTESGRIEQLGWRYIPNVGRPGAALSHATLYPVDVEYVSGSVGTGTVTWTRVDPWFHPMQHTTINALAELPILEYRPCLFAKTVPQLRGDQAREL
jgi:hypothetical protein